MRSAIITGFILTGTIFGQAPKLEFEVASVRAAAPRTPEERNIQVNMGGPGTSDPENVRFRMVRLSFLLPTAFAVTSDRLIQPAWTRTEQYDITAKIPPGTTEDQYAMMLRSLLIARFHIASHTEKRDFPVYNLVVAKGGIKMKPYSVEIAPAPDTTAPPDPAAQAEQLDQLVKRKPASDGFPVLAPGNQPAKSSQGTKDGTRTTARGQSLPEIAQLIQEELGGGARVTDKTGLMGRYDFKLQSTRQPNPADPDSLPDVVTAVQSQLGLKLEKSTAPFDVLIIDHIEKTPSEN